MRKAIDMSAMRSGPIEVRGGERRVWVTVLLGLVVVLGLAACETDAPPIDEAVEGEPEDEADAEQPEDEEPEDLEAASIRISFGPSAGLMGTFAFGLTEGVFADHGIELQIEDGAGSLVTAQDVAAGESDFTVVGGSALAQGVDEGMPLISVGALHARPQFGIIVPEDSDIEEFGDMEGRSVITSPGSPETVLMPAAFRAEGVDEGQVEEISVDAPAKASSYVQGLGDAVGTSWPFFASTFEAEGVPSRVLLFEEAGVGFPEFHVVTHTDTLEERPELIERFLRATYESLEGAYEEPETTIDGLIELRPEVSDPDRHVQSLLDHREFTCSDSMDGELVGYHVEQDWADGLEVLMEFGNLSDDADPDRFFTNEFFEGDDPVSERTCPWP